MPELPEVETIRRHLAPHVEGRTLEAVEILDARWCRPLAPAELAAAVEGRRVERLARRGKYLVWELYDDVYLLMHLRMTGHAAARPGARRRATRACGSDLGDHALVFDDPRRFGTGELALGPEALDAFFDARLGVEPLERDFTAEHLYALAQTSRAPIKAFLLDQKRVAGVGQHLRRRGAVPRPRAPAAAGEPAHPRAVRGDPRRGRRVAHAGLDAKGATIDDFRDPYGVSGSFQDQFLIHLREGEPCPNCGRPVRKLRAAGRGTYVCERCQPRPRTPRADALRRA